MRLGPTGLIEVACPFDPVTQAQLRRIRPAGRWLSRRHCWEFPLEAAAGLEQALAGRFPISAELAQWLVWLRQPLPPLPPHRQLVAAAALDQPLVDGRLLFAHQRAAARWLLARRGALLADAMGLGKTLSALAAARALVRLADCRLVVLAPAGLHHHWRQEAASLGLVLALHSWARLPPELPEAGCVLLVDEAHFAQTISAARTQAFLRLARHPRLRAIWLLSGTPMKNGRPSQLFPLLAAIGHPLGVDQRAFEERYCQGHWREQAGRRLWQAQGASQLEELQRLVRPLLLHRRKQPNPGMYSPIGGKLEISQGEGPHECALREIREEAGISLPIDGVRCMGVVSEKAYQGEMHWLIFLFETTRPVDHALVPEKEFDEGRLEWVPFEDVANKNIPWTDREIMWPAVRKHRGGFFMVHIDCSTQPPTHHMSESRTA
jgi:ADP-ribose pyrophosphatase YjhB (NUDIX family)